MKKIRITLVAVAAAASLSGSAIGVAAQDADERNDRTAGTLVSPGPLGRSYADWGGEWIRWWIGTLPMGTSECGLGDQATVVFAPAYQRTNRFEFGNPGVVESDCTIGSDQYILMPVGASICHTDESLVAQAEKAKGKKRKELERTADAIRLWAFRCIVDARSQISGPTLMVDGGPIPIDESYFTVTTPFVAKRADYPRVDFVGLPSVVIGSGYFAMLEPLAPGSHTIEWGWMRDFGDGPVSFENIVHAEVVEAAAE